MKSVNSVYLIFVILRLKGVIHAITPQIEIEPKHVMVKAGEQVTVLCRAGEPTQYCRITTPFDRVLVLGPTRPSREGYVYVGEGLENGQCGFRINNVQDQNNGIHGCYMGLLSDEASANMTVVVALPPSALPGLSVAFSTPGKSTNSDALQENDTFRAFCKVPKSRPAANITWFLDGNQIFEKLSQVAHEPSNCNVETSLCTSSQNLTRSVTWKDNGKQLACVMNHFALEIGSENRTTYQLNVQYKPHDDTSTQQFSFEIGKPGMITKQVYANPKPTFHWNIGRGVWLNENEESGHYKADEAVNKGLGAWFATLHIDPLTENDVPKVYQLRVTNSIGSTDFEVSISTMGAPGGVTLGADAIVGIVASIMIVFTIIFLVIFARRTGRWCFSHSSSNLIKKSDTAAPGNNCNEKMKKQKFNLADIFIKKKDKVADNSEELQGKTVMAGHTTPEEKQEHDIVYAELDLQKVIQPPVMRRGDDKTEYAEIIHTKNKVYNGN